MKRSLRLMLLIPVATCCIWIQNPILAAGQTPKGGSDEATRNENATAYEVTNYDMRCEMVPAKRSLAATALITIGALRDDVSSVRVFLHREFAVKSASREGHPLKVTYPDSSKDMLLFSRTGVPIDISLDRPLRKGGKGEIEIEYGGEMTSVIDGINLISESLVELAMYSSWFPLLHDGTHFTYSLRVTLPLNTVCVTDGELVQKTEESGKAVYSFRRTHQGFDIPLLASSDLKVEQLDARGFRAAFYYRKLEDADASEFIRQVVDGYKLLERKVGGAVASGSFVFVASPRGGGDTPAFRCL